MKTIIEKPTPVTIAGAEYIEAELKEQLVSDRLIN